MSSEVKNAALLGTAQALVDHATAILDANREDYSEAHRNGLDEAMLDRMMLNDVRLVGIASDVRAIAALPDPVGEIIEMRELSNGLQVGRQRVPLGVIGSIYESRPNVTIDISSLALKSGNAVLAPRRQGSHQNQYRACRHSAEQPGAASGVPGRTRCR